MVAGLEVLGSSNELNQFWKLEKFEINHHLICQSTWVYNCRSRVGSKAVKKDDSRGEIEVAVLLKNRRGLFSHNH